MFTPAQIKQLLENNGRKVKSIVPVQTGDDNPAITTYNAQKLYYGVI